MAAVLVAACAHTSPRDSVTDSRDVTVASSDRAPPPRTDGYVYVARRSHGAVGLVGSHFMTEQDAQRIVERIADDLELCARRLDEQKLLVPGALQLVAMTGTRGNAEITDMRVAPGGAVAAGALECVLAPLRASAFPVVTPAGTPALAVDVMWSGSRTQ